MPRRRPRIPLRFAPLPAPRVVCQVLLHPAGKMGGTTSQKLRPIGRSFFASWHPNRRLMRRAGSPATFRGMTMAVDSRVQPEIVQQEILDLSIQIQQIPAPTGAEGARAAWVADWLRRCGYAGVGVDQIGRASCRERV